MKRFTLLTAVLVTAVIVSTSSCHDKREPGRIYMPDMTYSRAVESYAQLDPSVYTDDTNRIGGPIFYNRMAVPGTIEHRDSNSYAAYAPYTLPNDSNGYKLSATIKNPLPPLVGKDSAEAARLFNINCAICHGADGKASGPLAVSGKVGGVANLTAGMYLTMADGTMYHSINYGKNNMGSYASQLDRKQRWMMVQYIRTLQPKAAPAVADTVKKG